MATEDKIKWNKKYNETPKLLEERKAGEKLISIIEKTNGKKALDVASGPGRNSIFLAKNGFDVLALDISSVAIENLQKKAIKNISCEIVDLDEYNFKKSCYDLIVMTNFLDRAVILKLLDALNKNGILFIETYMEHEENEKPPSNPDFLLKKDELKSFVKSGFETLDYDEFFNEENELYRMRKQSIAIKKL